MMEESPSFFFFYPPFVQDMLIIQTRLLLPSFPTPTNLMATKNPRGSEGQTGGASQIKKTRKCSERLQQDTASLICAVYHPHPKGSSSSWPWWQVPVSHCAFHPYRFRLAREPEHCHQHLFHHDSWHCLTRAEITFFGFGFWVFFNYSTNSRSSEDNKYFLRHTWNCVGDKTWTRTPLLICTQDTGLANSHWQRMPPPKVGGGANFHYHSDSKCVSCS